MNDPETYHAMQVPHESEAAANEAWLKFFEAVCEARKKHRIANVVVIGEAKFQVGGEVAIEATTGAMGDGSLVIPMVASALGALRQQQDDEIERLASGKE